ncbi:MAG TPA: choice-of-anchor tandem repeat GloVer-containing protein [Tepidisphaeraceae bacterium]|nr:choice-of-anchor tandem repeat GloVer-containing protein [Tepidisphaeraceae bacterium]
MLLSVYTPAQMRQAYGLVSSSGTNLISFNGTAGDGTGQTIGIVIPYNNPALLADASYVGLNGANEPTLQIFNQTGGTNLQTDNPAEPAWYQEAAQDMEWAHYIAPGANIIIVEGDDNTLGNLVVAEQTAANEPGVSVVANSWGGAEPSQSVEQTDDAAFTTPAGHQGVTFLAGAGDNGADYSATAYPSVSPNVISVGGASLSIDAQNNWTGETAWSLSGGNGGGGQLSQYEAQPSYQVGNVNGASTTVRATPDVSMDADPSTGGEAYDAGSTFTADGSSLSTPMWAGLIAVIDQGRALAGQGSLTTQQALTSLYTTSPSCFHDIVSGNNGYAATSGYDMATGLGTPIADVLIPTMAGYSTANQLAFTQQSISVTGGASGLPTVTVDVENSQGSIITTDNSAVTLSVYDGQGTGISHNGGSVTVNAVNGVATFNNLWLSPLPNLGGVYKLEAADGSDLAATLNLNVNPGASRSANITTLASFDYTNSGEQPYSGLSVGPDGTLYGTTQSGGDSGNGGGTVFDVKNGTLTTLATFPTDGYNFVTPSGSLAVDASGNIYGTTQYTLGSSSGGTVFEVVAGSGTVTTLYTFTGGADGGVPMGGLIMDSSGNLYGTTSQGGANGGGTLFKFDPATQSMEGTPISFSANTGINPEGPLLMDVSGDLFGTTNSGSTSQGGGYNTTYGTVFEVVAGSSTITPLVSFDLNNGANPRSGLVIDSAGNLFGTTTRGGAFTYYGTAFEIKKGSGRITVLASFDGSNEDETPSSGLTLDRNGNLFGTTQGRGYGRVFEIAAGSSTISTVATFDGSNGNGVNPVGGVYIDKNGNMFGNTESGGAYGAGTVFELPGATNPPWLAGDGATWDGTTLSVSGSATIIADPADYGASPIVTASGSLADLEVQPTNGDTSIHLASVNLQSGALLQMAPTARANTDTLYLSGLSIDSSSKLDLGNSSMTLSYTPGNDPIATIRQYLVSGDNNTSDTYDGTWNGTGIDSSVANSFGNSTWPYYALGYADSADGVVQGMAADTIKVMFTLVGDTNLDGTVNMTDWQTLSRNFGSASGTWDTGDDNYDGTVSQTDLTALTRDYGHSV